MRKIAVALLLAWSSAVIAAEPPGPAETADCTAAIATAERSGDIPAGLLAAIGRIESGRAESADGVARPWPWTINVGGAGRFFATKTEAVAATAELGDRGIVSVDVGCMQVNLMHHPAAFASLDEAFDPLANALYAARFLRLLFNGSGDWSTAVAAYHSQTREVGAAYQGKVLASWTPPTPISPSAADRRYPRFVLPDWIGGERDGHRSSIEAKFSLPEGAAPAAARAWIARVIGDVAGCSTAAEAGPAPGNAPSLTAATWNTAAVNCPSSPFAKPAMLRQLLAQH
jgi:transglycosylase-like protein with SLT domain